jgi:hypothetical protein
VYIKRLHVIGFLLKKNTQVQRVAMVPLLSLEREVLGVGLELALEELHVR